MRIFNCLYYVPANVIKIKKKLKNNALSNMDYHGTVM